MRVGRVFREELWIEELSQKGFPKYWVFQGFLEAEGARGKMMQNNLSLFCGRLGTLAASGVQSWGAPRGSVSGTFCSRGCGCTVPAGNNYSKVRGTCLTSDVFLQNKSAVDLSLVLFLLMF